MPNDKKNKSVRNLLMKGGQITGSAIGGALGFLTAGPVGAAGAAVAGSLIGHVLEDVVNRTLSDSEERKVGSVASLAISTILGELEKGNTLRDDGFFEVQSGNVRAEAEEVFEGVLFAAQSEHEEKKLRYLSYLYANIAFGNHCSAEEANYLINLLKSLTYNQVKLLKIILEKDRFNLRGDRIVGGESISYFMLSCYEQLFALIRNNLIQQIEPNSSAYTIVMTFKDIVPQHLQLTLTGERLIRLAAIHAMDEDEVSDIVLELANKPIEPTR